MSRRLNPQAIVFLLLGFFLGASSAALSWQLNYARRWKDQLASIERRLALAESERDRFHALVGQAEKAKALARNKAQREAVEKAVVEIRGLPFKSPVDYEVLDRKQIKATIAGKLREVFSDEEFANITKALARLGLLDPGYPLREKYIDLLGEQVAAFYDQHQHKLFMFEDASLDSAQNRVVLAHELTHALQDQHFGLNRLPLELKTNDDRAAAAAALVEGEATLVMSEYMLKNLSLGSLKDSLSATFAQDMAQLAKAPAYLRELLVFPYLRGQEFCAALYARGEYAAVTKAYENPPASTAQILHPEKFLAEPREEPIAIDWPDTTVRGEKPIVDNVLGELGIRILLSEWVDPATGERAAAGWRGDRYACFAKGEAIAWKSVWGSEAEANEFMEAEKRTLARRYAKDAAPARVVRWHAAGNAVLLVDAPDEAWAAALEERFGRLTGAN